MRCAHVIAWSPPPYARTRRRRNLGRRAEVPVREVAIPRDPAVDDRSVEFRANVEPSRPVLRHHRGLEAGDARVLHVNEATLGDGGLERVAVAEPDVTSGDAASKVEFLPVSRRSSERTSNQGPRRSGTREGASSADSRGPRSRPLARRRRTSGGCRCRPHRYPGSGRRLLEPRARHHAWRNGRFPTCKEPHEGPRAPARSPRRRATGRPVPGSRRGLSPRTAGRPGRRSRSRRHRHLGKIRDHHIGARREELGAVIGAIDADDQREPAPMAGSTPASASSTTTARRGGTRRRRAASKKSAGSGCLQALAVPPLSLPTEDRRDARRDRPRAPRRGCGWRR